MNLVAPRSIFIKPYNLFYILCAVLVTQFSTAASTSNKHYYRYYDANGIATISSSITPKHIQRGYDVLDQNMLILQHINAFNSQNAAQKSQRLEAQAKQHIEDQQIKNAYGSRKIAELKKQDRLAGIQKQLGLQQKQLSQLYQDQIVIKRQEQEDIRLNKTVSAIIKTRIQNNDLKINQTKQSILGLQTRLRQTQQEYDHIISRLNQ